MREDCPVKFRYKGKVIKGYLTPVKGAASNTTFFLMSEDNRYYGSLSHTADHWRFSSQDKALDHLAEKFGSMVISWLDSQEEEVEFSVLIPDFGDYFKPMEFPGGEIPRYPMKG